MDINVCILVIEDDI